MIPGDRGDEVRESIDSVALGASAECCINNPSVEERNTATTFRRRALRTTDLSRSSRTAGRLLHRDNNDRSAIVSRTSVKKDV